MCESGKELKLQTAWAGEEEPSEQNNESEEPRGINFQKSLISKHKSVPETIFAGRRSHHFCLLKWWVKKVFDILSQH